MKSLHGVKCLLWRVGLLSATLTAAVSLSARTGHAALIAPGTTMPVPYEPDPFLGTILASLTVPVAAPTFSGILTSQVIDDPANALGGLTFTYELTNNATSARAIGRFTVPGFSLLLTDVSTRAPFPPGPIPPTFVDRSGGSEDVIGFAFYSAPFGTVLLPGATTTLLVIQTDSHSYGAGLANVIDGSVATTGAYMPAVPEPGTWILLGLGSLGLLRMARGRCLVPPTC